MPRPLLSLVCVVALLLVSACSDDTNPGSDASAADQKSGAPDIGGSDAITAPVVTTGSGPVKGVGQGKARSFLGIPYAAPPTKGDRFKPPRPVKPWTSARAADAYGPSCPQDSKAGLGLPKSFSEDCLTLNVFAPRPAPAKPAPVMVWIHGGGFYSGGSALPTYDGRQLAAQKGVVVVTFNYRLGALGFFSHPAVEGGTANLGIQDQQAALKWVQSNIAAFGGDPKNVTLFGESAGSMSVCVHLASPASKGLFHRAAMQSGACSVVSPTLAVAQKQGQDLAKKLTCHTAKDVAACLRAAKADAVQQALPTKSGFLFGSGVTWEPVVDGKVLPKQPYTLVKEGAFNKVPLLIGTNKDEGTLFLLLLMQLKMDQTKYASLVNQLYKGDAAKVLARYPATSYKATSMLTAPALAFADMITDMAFVCQTRLTARAAAAAGVSVYQYHFTVTQKKALLAFLGSTHTAELPFVFNSDSKLTSDEDALSKKMMGYWTSFAAAGDPNTTGQVAWPKFDAATHRYLELSQTTSAKAGLKKAACAFWDTMPPPGF